METLNELDKIGADLLTKMPEILQNGVEYGGELFEKFVLWKAISLSVDLFVGVVLLAVAAMWLNYARKNWNNWKDVILTEYKHIENTTCWPFAKFVTAISVPIAAIVGFIYIEFAVSRLIKLIIFPELYIIDYFIK